MTKTIISNEQFTILARAVARARVRVEAARNRLNMLTWGEPINQMARIRALTRQIAWHEEWVRYGEELLTAGATRSLITIVTSGETRDG